MIYCIALFLTALLPPFFEVEKETPVLPSIQKILNDHIQKFQIPGMAVVFYDEGKEYFFFHGFADQEKKIAVGSNTLFRLASITKVFTSTVLSLKVVQDKMRLTDSVSKYLKFNESDIVKNGIAKVTLVNLATHTSSLPKVLPNKHKKASGPSVQTEAEVINYLNNWKPAYPIATRYLYSNLGMAVLGMVLAHENRSSYWQLLNDSILKPLKMHETEINIATETPGSGALYSTISDMLKFLRANLGVEGPKELMTAMDYASQEFFIVNKQLSMGLGWQRFRATNDLIIIEKNGGLPGFSSYIGFTKGKKKTGIVILCNKRSVKATELGRQIIRELQ